MSKRVKEALADRAAAENALSEVIKAEYPIGSPIAWEMSGDVRLGTVVRHGYGDRINVKNQQSGKTYWIYAYRIIERAA